MVSGNNPPPPPPRKNTIREKDNDTATCITRSNSLITSCEIFLSPIAILACYSLKNSLVATFTHYALEEHNLKGCSI